MFILAWSGRAHCHVMGVHSYTYTPSVMAVCWNSCPWVQVGLFDNTEGICVQTRSSPLLASQMVASDLEKKIYFMLLNSSVKVTSATNVLDIFHSLRLKKWRNPHWMSESGWLRLLVERGEKELIVVVPLQRDTGPVYNAQNISHVYYNTQLSEFIEVQELTLGTLL